MLTHLEKWHREVVPLARELLKDLKHSRMQLERDIVDERSDRPLKDLTHAERSEVARCIAFVLHKEGVVLERDRIEAVLKKLRRKYHNKFEEAERKQAVVNAEGVAYKETIHWLTVFWEQYREDVGQFGYEAYQRDRRYLLGSTSQEDWFSHLTFYAALRHRIFTQDVKPELPQHDRYEYRLMSDVEEQMSKQQKHHLSQIKRESEATKARRQQLLKDGEQYGWMGVGAQTLDHALQATEKRLKDTTQLIETTQQLHKEAIHWLKTEAISQAERLRDLCQRSPAAAVPVLPAAAGDAAVYVKSRVERHVADFLARMDTFAKDECVAYVEEQMTQHSHRTPLPYSQVDYFRRWKEHQLQSYKGDMARRKRLVHDTALTWTEQLLDRTHRPFLLSAATDQAQHFQQALIDPSRFPVSDDDEVVDADEKDEEEALQHIRRSIEASLTTYDESAILHLWLSQLLAALRESSESLWRLSQTQWKNDLRASCTIFLSLQGLKYDQNVASFRAMEQQERAAVSKLNREGLDHAWSVQMHPYMEYLTQLEELLHEAVETHRQRALECATQCLESYIPQGTTGDIPASWFYDSLVNTPEVQTLLQRTEEGLKKKSKKKTTIPPKDAELVSLQQKVLQQTARHPPSSSSPSTISYSKVDNFCTVLHYACLTLAL